MLFFWFSAAFVVSASVAYHLCQKSIPAPANPMVSVIVTFGTAGVASLLLLPLFLRGASLGQELGKLNWASIALGLTIVGIDVGYLLLYRAGWNISLGSAFCNALVALALLPIGILLFKERLVPLNYVGVVLTLVGIFLIIRR